VGKYFGYDAFVMVPEGSAEASVHQRGGEHAAIPLGFQVFCRNFVTEYYANGTPREYRSDLEILDSEKKVLSKSITVNDPLKYKGLTFFQSSYQPMENEYKLIVTKKKKSAPEGAETGETIFIRPATEHKASGLGVSFKILATSSDGHGHGPYKLQFDDKDASPLELTVDDREVVNIERSEAVYTISLAQRFATGLKVVKDPGVWIVYLGCGLMLLGLYISFFMSHVRVWIVCQCSAAGMKISILGTTNKNFTKLDQVKERIAVRLLSEDTLDLRRG
jgi:cytochrome c biogenesis protein